LRARENKTVQTCRHRGGHHSGGRGTGDSAIERAPFLPVLALASFFVIIYLLFIFLSGILQLIAYCFGILTSIVSSCGLTRSIKNCPSAANDSTAQYCSIIYSHNFDDATTLLALPASLICALLAHGPQFLSRPLQRRYVNLVPIRNACLLSPSIPCPGHFAQIWSC
jgi:hypothetical protein